MSFRAITSSDLYRFRWVEDPQISPDGQKIAFVVRFIDKETNTYKSSIWMTSVTNGLGGAYQFTSDGKKPRWSPDGQMLAFISTREGLLPKPQEEESAEERDRHCGKGKPQFWLMPTHGGEAHQLTFLRHGVGSAPIWSPDSLTILFVSQTGESIEDTQSNGKTEPQTRRITHLFYRLDNVGFTYELRDHLFTISAQGGEPRQLTNGDWNDSSPSWSPDGQKIVFESDRRQQRWLSPKSTLWMINADGTHLSQLTADDDLREYSHPVWSPNGQSIACLGWPQWQSGGHVDVFVMSLSNQPRCLTQEHFVTFSEVLVGDQRSSHADPTPHWSKDGSQLYVIGTARGSVNVYRLSIADSRLEKVTAGDHHVIDFSIDASQNAVAFACSDACQPGDIYVHWQDSGTTLRLTDVNAEVLEEVQISIPEAFEFTGAKGWNIEGWILKPYDFSPDGKYPLLLEIHGGPNAAYGWTFFHESQVLAAQGYVVVYTNPRGSVGYGRVFGQAIHGDWGGADYEDLMAGVDAVVARGYIDTARMGVLGGSYGGYMTNWIVGHTDRFSAAVTQRCVSNLVSMMGTCDFGYLLHQDQWQVMPWEDPQLYQERSPITYVQQMKTPLLIIHSTNDWRCPIEQGEQLFTYLKVLGREVELLVFEGQSHELNRSGHPRLRVENLDAIKDWFVSHIPAKQPEPSMELTEATSSKSNGYAPLEILGEMTKI
jgi:dipeptidyl aminopeptidase/acylaminoacyl peptidase